MSIVTQGYAGGDGALVTQGYGDILDFIIGYPLDLDVALVGTQLMTFRIDVAISKDGEILSPDEFEWITRIERDNLWTSIER